MLHETATLRGANVFPILGLHRFVTQVCTSAIMHHPFTVLRCNAPGLLSFSMQRAQVKWRCLLVQALIETWIHAAQAAEARVMEPDKCESWIWVPWLSIPQPVFLPLQLLQESGYDPLRHATQHGTNQQGPQV